MNKDDKPNLVPYGWAKGDYWCICNNCGGQHTGDKKSPKCKGCALAAYERANTAPAQVDLLFIEAVIDRAIKTNEAHHPDGTTNAIAIARTLQSQGYLKPVTEQLQTTTNCNGNAALESLKVAIYDNGNLDLYTEVLIDTIGKAINRPNPAENKVVPASAPITQDEARSALNAFNRVLPECLDAYTPQDVNVIRKALTPHAEEDK